MSKTKIQIAVFGLAGFFVLMVASCATYRLEKKLKPEESEWLSEVRYIITPEEKKIFLEMPESERKQFIEDFWKRRDPDPDTEVNEFKDEYYKRMEEANKMFRGEGRPGWLTDRGRIYILFGPPTERQTFPMESRGYCREVWYYGSFPVIFIDENCSGNYVLSAINLEHLQDLNLAQNYFQRQAITQEKSFFDYDLKVSRIERSSRAVKLLVTLSMSYDEIWFEVMDNASLQAELILKLELKDAGGKVLWQGEKSFTLTFKDEDELKRQEVSKFKGEMEVQVPQDEQSPLPPGKYLLYSSVKQKTDGKEIKKVQEIRL